ncbi:MAG TPA: hypothetical protein VEC14_05120 [Reyranellaceae bacterium]|nr:hypothetical protein [Reyranellaceae bacterium]
MSVTLKFEPTQRILLVQFTGALSSENLNGLDSEVVAFVKKEGAPKGFVIDCSQVEEVSVPTGEFVRRGQRNSVVSDQDRVYVMPRADMFGLGRMFGTYQRMVGKKEPIVVKTLTEAFDALKLDDPNFQPLPPEVGGGLIR